MNPRNTETVISVVQVIVVPWVINQHHIPLRTYAVGFYHNFSIATTIVRLLLCEWAGLLLSNLVVPYETTRIIGVTTCIVLVSSPDPTLL